MPEISEVQRPRTELLSQNEPQEDAQATRTRDLKENLSFIAILSLVLRSCDVPLVTLASGPGVEGRSYGLGVGVSSTVTRYEVSEGLRSICGSSNMVALKKYLLTLTEPTQIAASAKRLHRLLWQELQVFCHPFLKEHENICRLMFVGWEDTSLLPVLALEHATYGTLAKALQHLRSYGSDLRKSHLTADIAAGLAALHACGLVHGDIKTSNIIIQEHPSRSIVAKLSDFNGVSSTSTFRHESYLSFGTPIWQPPEVLFSDDEPDGQSADIYALGMIIATLWTATGFIPEGGTFLDPVLPYNLDSSAKVMLVGSWKLYSDSCPASLPSIATLAVGDRSTAPIPVRFILSQTLSSLPDRRVNARTLLSTYLGPFLQQHGREISAPEPHLEAPPAYDDDDSYLYGVTGIHGYNARTNAFKQLFLATTLETATRIWDSVHLPHLPDLENPYGGDIEEIVTEVRDRDKTHQSLLLEAKIPASLQMLSNQIFLSFLYGCGTRVNEALASTWLHCAAHAGAGNAIHWYCALEQSMKEPMHLEAPRRLWAATAAHYNFEGSSTYLKDVDPDLYALATLSYRCRFWGRHNVQIRHFEEYFESFASAIRSDPSKANAILPSRRDDEDVEETPLHFCAATGKLDFAKFLVLEAGADVNATNIRNETPIFYATRAGQYEMARFLFQHDSAVTHVSTEGISIMHCLALMDDDSAAELCPLYLSRGGSISLEASEVECDYVDMLCRGSGLPIMWAVDKKRQRLFEALLEAHKEKPMSQQNLKDLLERLAQLNLSEMLDKTLSSAPEITDLALSAPQQADVEDVQTQLADLSVESEMETTPFATEEPGAIGEILSREYLSSLLELALEHEDFSSIQRRYLHKKEFHSVKQSTITVLLNHGADPLVTDDEDSSPLITVVCHGDKTVLELFVEHLTARNVDLETILSNKENFGRCNALVRSIYADDYDSFLFLLNRYPSLKNTADSQGRTSLHIAATQASPHYTQRLLEHGADRYTRALDGATPFIWAVMNNPNIEVANLLAQDANMEEVLGPDPNSGFTAFAKVVSAMTRWKMDIKVSRLRYLVDNYGLPSFYCNVPSRGTIFETLLRLRTPFTDREQIELEAIVFEYLVQLFPDKINVTDTSGMAPLHVAAAYANVPAARILLEHGADANVLTVPSEDEEDDDDSGGYSPLDLAVMAMRRGPDRHLRAGLIDIQMWQQNMKAIVELLGRHGGDSGPAADASTSLRGSMLLDPEGWSAVSVMDTLTTPDIEDRTGDAEWPRRLPWEATPEPFAVEQFTAEGNEAVEVIHSNGLSTRMPAETLRIMQTIVGAIDPGVRRGNMAPQPPPPPEGYLDALQSGYLYLQEEWKAVLQSNWASELAAEAIEWEGEQAG